MAVRGSIVVGLVALLGLLGCDGDDSGSPTTTPPSQSTEPTATAAPSVETTVRPRVDGEPARMPLTGEPLAFGQTPPDRPALVVKIDNVGAGRPQTGLNQADIVFEEIVEGRLTRFAAVFHSQGSNPVGPIRSGRTQDIDLLSALSRPLFAWSGGNPGVTAAIENADIVSINAARGGGGFFRTDRPAPHNLYNTTDALWAQAPLEAEPPDPLFRYVLPDEPVEGTNVSWLEVRVGANPVRWEWSPECTCFLRSQYGSPHELTDGQATADNVVVLLTQYRPSAADARSPEAVTVGDGRAYVMSDGTLQVGVWERTVNTDPVRLFTDTSHRQPIEITPGRTWVELADVNDYDIETG